MFRFAYYRILNTFLCYFLLKKKVGVGCLFLPLGGERKALTRKRERGVYVLSILLLGFLGGRGRFGNPKVGFPFCVVLFASFDIIGRLGVTI